MYAVRFLFVFVLLVLHKCQAADVTSLAKSQFALNTVFLRTRDAYDDVYDATRLIRATYKYVLEEPLVRISAAEERRRNRAAERKKKRAIQALEQRRKKAEQRRKKAEQRRKKRQQQARQTPPKWPDRWKRWFVRYVKRLPKTGRGDQACIIPDKQLREVCCEQLVNRTLSHRMKIWMKRETLTKQWNRWVNPLLRFCAGLTERHFEQLRERSLVLEKGDENLLKVALTKVLNEPDCDEGENEQLKVVDGQELMISPEPLRGDDDEDGWKMVRKKNKQQLREQVEKERQKEHKLILHRYLYVMKLVESLNGQYNLLDEPLHEGMYRRFRRGFRRLYNKKKTGVFYHAVDRIWMTCGLVRYKSATCMYCARLKSIDKHARQLRRNALLGWESGRTVHKVQIVGENRMELQYAVRDDSDSDDSDSDDDEEYLGFYQVRETRRFTYVNLFGGGGRCPTANLGYACFAMCCDTVFRFSWICRMTRFACIGD